MSRTLILLVSGAAWAFMMAELVKREVLPYYEYEAPPTYRTLLQTQRDTRIQRWSVWLGVDRIGSVESLLEPAEQREARLRTRASYDLPVEASPPTIRPFLHGPLRVEAWSDLRIDTLYQLSSLEFAGRVMGLPGFVEGVRVGERLTCAYEMQPLARGSRVIDFPRDTTLFDSWMPFPGGRLRAGKKWTLTTIDFDPKEVFKLSTLYALVESRQALPWDGDIVDVWRIDITKKPVDAVPVMQLFVDDAGRVLEQRRNIEGFELRCVLEDSRAAMPAERRVWLWDPPKKP